MANHRKIETDPKQCNKCFRWVPLEGFQIYPNGGLSHHNACKECRAAWMREWHARNKAEQNAKSIQYYKDHRTEILDRAHRYSEENRELLAKKARDKYWANPEKAREYARQQWERNGKALAIQNRMRQHVRRGQMQEGPRTTLRQVEDRMAYFGNRCWICGGPFEHIDHHKPLSRGGLHCASNLRPTCQSCNNQKYAQWPIGAERLAEIRERSNRKREEGVTPGKSS